MKKFLAMMLVFLMLLSLAACGGSPGNSNSGGDSGSGQGSGSAGTITLKAGMSGNETSPTYVALSEFKRLVEERTEGRYEIEIYTNDQLSSGEQMKAVEMTMNGTIDIGMHAGSLWGTYVPQIQVVSTPFLFSSYDEADKLVLDPESEGYKLIEGWLGEKGVHTLGILEQGFRQLSNSKKEILTPDDIKGMKFRVPQTSMLIDAFAAMDASASPMSFSEVYTALQQGTIDGQENPLSAMVTGKFEEVQKYVTMWNYSYDIFVINASGKVWDSLSDEDKAIFEECGKEACAAEIAASREADDGFRKIVEDAGVQITELTAEQQAAFAEACASVYEKYRDTMGEDVYAAFGYEFN
ncbi:DctP family TRAP transporter solute-binding subunit [Oscillibacter sp. 1-3]|uniref:DctP family TRAP transporter solute-binding subunit n=1 Tax=Oscillibacter sp. 1-3 TaxID=1235797 RepID=UPI00033538B4|nr:DctP family TRAP transporter solute-binding subunit [Oscillibacter sp. 1-3]EOS67025.1 DctP family TRAP transporter solute receptor [Oscillibacter sp. 1-3]